jgi:hypothetical protein
MSDTYALLKTLSVIELSGTSLLLCPSARICAPAHSQIERGYGDNAKCG